jgi:hypothetical protein
MRKLTFVTGLVTGYVLGARAGRQRYEQIAKTVRGVTGHPAVVKARATARTRAKGVVGAGINAATAKIGHGAGSKDDPVIDGTA